jgi:peptide/nickel transport system substrate-binding protein
VFAFENYISRQVAGLWFPTEETWSVVESDLKGWTPQNPFGFPEPSQWYFSGR